MMLTCIVRYPWISVVCITMFTHKPTNRNPKCKPVELGDQLTCMVRYPWRKVSPSPGLLSWGPLSPANRYQKISPANRYHEHNFSTGICVTTMSLFSFQMLSLVAPYSAVIISQTISEECVRIGLSTFEKFLKAP